MKTPKAKVAVAIFVVVLLGVFGISWLGGETWVSATASSEAGWRAYTGPFTPQPPSFLRPFLIPSIMILAVIAVSVLGAILNRLSRKNAESAPPDQTVASG